MFEFFLTTCLGFLLFFNSPQRMAVLDQVAHLRIPRSSATRWNCKSKIVQTGFELRSTLIECCTILEDSFSESSESGANGIKRMLSNPSFFALVKFFNKVMPYVDILFA